MSFNDLLKDTCTINVLTQGVHPTEGNTITTTTAVHASIKCQRIDKSKSMNFSGVKDSIAYTDLFLTNFLTGIDTDNNNYSIVHETNTFKVVGCENPASRNHHLEFYTELMK